MEHASHTRDIATTLRERVVPSNATRYGVVIGIEQYRDERLNLRCARADAEAMYRLMIDPECGMFTEEHVTLLLDDQATRENIRQTLAALPRRAATNDTVWIYYAGHAASEGGNIFWVPWDGDVDNLYLSGFPRREVLDILDDVPSERLVLFLDCCHAAAMATQKHGTRDNLTADEVFAAFEGTGRLALAASDGKDKSVELPDKGHGAFSYYLVDGLRGAADVESSGVVTLDSLWVYLHDKVTKASQSVGNPQKPRKLGEHGHDLALTVNPLVMTRKRQIASAIEELTGLGPDRLTTTEAEYCLELLRRGPQSELEYDVIAEFDSLADGVVKLPSFKRLLKAASAGHADAHKEIREKPIEPPGPSAGTPDADDTLEMLSVRDRMDREEAVRCIDRWSVENPVYLNPLSHHSEVTTVDNWGVFTIEIEALVESRLRQTALKPFDVEAAESQIDVFDSDIWSLPIGKPHGIASGTYEWRAVNPERITFCDSCGGRCDLQCSACSGIGKTSCKSCAGTGEWVCGTCHGKALVQCQRCKGVGKDPYSSTGPYMGQYTDKKCDRCHGNKTMPCEKCNGTPKHTCTTCGGNPQQPCATCGANGMVSCTKCAGAGKQAAYPVVKATFDIHKHKMLTGKRPAYVQTASGALTLLNTSPVLQTSSEGPTCPELSESLPRSVIRELTASFASFIASQSGRVVRTRISVAYTHCVSCSLAHQSIPFEIHLVGQERRVVTSGPVPKDEEYERRLKAEKTQNEIIQRLDARIDEKKQHQKAAEDSLVWCIALSLFLFCCAVGAFVAHFFSVEHPGPNALPIIGSVLLALAVPLGVFVLRPIPRKRDRLKQDIDELHAQIIAIKAQDPGQEQGRSGASKP